MDNRLAECGLDNSVAQTLLIPLYMKSQESKRPNAFFSDPIASELIDSLDFDFSFFKNSVRSSVGCAIRSGYFDMMLTEFARLSKNCVIVNIGCGLDTRYERVKSLVPMDSMFYHLDLPEVIELREKLVIPAQRDRSIKASLFDTEWMDTLKEQHHGASFLFIFEGVLMYFENKQVRAVFNSLSERFPKSDILFDATSCWMRDNSHRHDTLKYTNARFKLGMDTPKEIEEWNKKLRLVSTRYYSDFPEWKHVGFVNYYMMKLIPEMKRASYLVHAKIK